MNPRFLWVLFVLLFCVGSTFGQGHLWKVGTSVRVITPQGPMWMAGYAARTRPSEGVTRELHAKALALEDPHGRRAVLVTFDLLGFHSEWVEGIADRIRMRVGLSRDQILFNASHTHSGPALERVLAVAYTLTPEQHQQIRDYSRQLADTTVDLVVEAVSRLAPARLSTGHTTVGFAVNRRVPGPDGYVIGANRLGPVDHQVPVLVVDTPGGTLKAVVFGYACHNTTLQGENYHYHGDYAGAAQAWLEERHHGAVAYFVTGAAGDANPYPRGTLELAEEHGATLGSAVDRALTGPLNGVTGRLRTVFDRVSLRFAELPDREEWLRRVNGDDIYRKRHAQHYLKVLEEKGEISREYSYPVQVWSLGDRTRIVALAGEVVVDYARRLRLELDDPGLWVAGYSNDVSFYVPSERVLGEGGYEAVDSMIFYGQPGPFEPSVEGLIVGQVRELVKRIEGEADQP